MAMNDPVLQRSMFSGPRSAPSAPAASGVGSLTTPDQNAQALRSMFRAPPSMAFSGQGMQPVQSFQTGGIAERVEITPPPILVEGPVPSEAPSPAPAREPPAEPPAESPRRASRLKIAPGRFSETPPAPSEPSGEPRAPGIMDLVRGSSGSPLLSLGRTDFSGVGEFFERARDRFLRSRGVPEQTSPLPPPRPQQLGEATISPEERARMLDADRTAESGSYAGRPGPAPAVAPAPAPAAPPPASAPSVSTSLEEIRSRREAKEAALTAAERRENGLLALMQAGFATAAGTSPNALSNIGAGGQAGIAAFANLEKSRREDAAARRREQLSREISTAQLQKEPDQIRTYAMMGGWTPDQGREGLQAAVARGMQIQKTMQPDPEMIRTFQILGGGDVRKGFELYNADKKLQAAIAVTKDITAAEEDRKAATEYIRTQLMQTRTGGATAFPGFSATPVR